MAFGRTNIGSNLAGRRNINVIASSTQPTATKVGDVWVKTTNTIGQINIQETEPTTKATGDIWINIGNVKSKFNIKQAMKYIGRTETEINVLINSADVLSQVPSSPNVEFWKSAALSLYAAFGSVRYWNGSKWIFLVAYYWDGSTWSNFSQDNYVTYVKSYDKNIYKVLPDGTASLFYTTSYSIARQLAVDTYGNVYIPDTTSLKKFDRNGNLIWTYAVNCGPVEVDGDGNVYFMDFTAYAIKKLSSAGVILQIFPTLSSGYASSAVDLLVNVQGNVYISHVASTAQRVKKYNSAGTLVWDRLLAGESDGSSITLDELDNVYYINADSHSISVVYSDGTAANITDISTTTGSVYAWIAIDKAHNLYAYGSDNTTLYKLSSAGATLWTTEEMNHTNISGNAVTSIAVDRDGYVYMGEFKGDYTKISPSGQLVWTRIIGSTDGTTINNIAVEPGRFGANPSAW